jgi:hypothetical protein
MTILVISPLGGTKNLCVWSAYPSWKGSITLILRILHRNLTTKTGIFSLKSLENGAFMGIFAVAPVRCSSLFDDKTKITTEKSYIYK